jgi:hypothetical protein
MFMSIRAQFSVVTVKVADAHAHIQRLGSGIKMATVFEVYTTGEQRSDLRFFLWTKGLVIKDILLGLGTSCTY